MDISFYIPLCISVEHFHISLYLGYNISLLCPSSLFPNTITSSIQPPGNKIYTHRIGYSSVYQSTVFRHGHMYTIPHSPFISILLISHILSCLSSSIILAPIRLLGRYSFCSILISLELNSLRPTRLTHPCDLPPYFSLHTDCHVMQASLQACLQAGSAFHEHCIIALPIPSTI